MSSRQGETFQEIIQRYNRELMKLQKQAAVSEEMDVVTEITTPTSPGSPSPLPAALEESGRPLQQEAPAFQVDPEGDFVDYNPGPLLPELDSDDAGVPVPLPIEIPGEDGSGCICPLPEEDSETDPVTPPDISGCEAENPLHSQTVGPTGPVLLQDGILHELLEGFVYGNRLPRPIHQKGWGAMGSFRCLRSMSAYTQADFLQEAGRSVPVAVRFSQAAGGAGAPDTLRGIRGMSAKFYTDTGNFDLVCNSLPVFFIRDAIRFPEMAAALSPSPASNLPDPQRLWAFIARTPEATNMAAWYYSDAGTVQSYRRMRAYGVNTFVWKNASGVRRYVKYHWIPLAGERYLDQDEAERRRVRPDLLGQDLYDTIARGEAVEFDLAVQLMDPADGETLAFDPLDCTKIWDERLYPLTVIGRMALNRNPENYQEQVEELAFSPANLVEGIELSRDKVLQGRSFIYWDSQRRRLGPDFRNLPVNRPLKGVWSPERLVTSGEGTEACGEQIRASIPKTDNFSQAGERYRSLDTAARERLVDNIARELYRAPAEVQTCVTGYFYRADAQFGTEVIQMIESYSKRR